MQKSRLHVELRHLQVLSSGYGQYSAYRAKLDDGAESFFIIDSCRLCESFGYEPDLEHVNLAI
jgi:hypothetical protein